MKPIELFMLLALVCAVPACQESAAKDDDVVRARMAGDLVQCKNDLSSQKEKLAELQAEVEKLKATSDPTVHLPAVELRAGEKHMDGNIPPEQLSAVIGRNSSGLRSCYERALKHNPDLQFVASVNVQFSVKNNGAANNVEFRPHHDLEMEKCMATAIGRWRFPSFQGDAVQVEAPVSLVAR